MMAAESPLQSFLASPTGANLADFEEVRGFIFAVAGAPDLVQPSEWLPEAFAGELPEFESPEQAEAVLQDLMGMYNLFVSGKLRIKKEAPAFREPAISNLDEKSAVACWCRGYYRGYSWLVDVWREYLPEELEEELVAIVLVLTFFESRQMAETCREETGQGKSLEEIAELMRLTFPKAMIEYVRLGQSIYEIRLQDDRRSVTPSAKIGRNDPCPCGSGQKYKKCCGAISD
jgi:uncharacterized protein